MTASLSQGTDIISEDQRAFYDEQGYLLLESFVTEPWLSDLRAAADEFVEKSRSITSSNKMLDVEPNHTPDKPRLRRLISPIDHHETFARFMLEGPAAQLATALLGGMARFHHCKLNYKWADGGEEIKWHQDIQFWPHTDFTPLTIGVYLDDVDDEMGPMGVLPGSHRGELYDLYNPDGSWGGAMRDDDIAGIDLAKMAWLRGPAGSVTVHNCCMVHGSVPNSSPRPRPLLLQTYSAADSFPLATIGANSILGAYGGTIIGGDRDDPITVDGRAMRCAPDFATKGTPTIFNSQQGDLELRN